MNERKFKIFYMVATELNMTQAAAKLYLSQPAVSQTIHELETEYEVKFFDRIGKKLFLTQEGQEFFQYVRRILNLYAECSQTIDDIKGLKKGKLRVGASTTTGIYILTDLIGGFQKLNPEIEVSMVIENTRIIADLILENRIDFAFVEGQVDSPEILVEYFCDDELVFIVSSEHPWTSRKKITFQDVAKEKFIMREQGSGTREVVENALNFNGIDYHLGMELGNTEAIKKAVEAGLGISCISRRCIEREIEDHRLCVIKISGLSINRKLSLIIHKDKYLSNLFKYFIGFCKETVI